MLNSTFNHINHLWQCVGVLYPYTEKFWCASERMFLVSSEHRDDVNIIHHLSQILRRKKNQLRFIDAMHYHLALQFVGKVTISSYTLLEN